MSEVDFEFATQDDCLQKMVPSDLRAIIAEHKWLREEKEELIKVLELALEALESMSATLYGTTTPREKEALVTLRRALGKESDHGKALNEFVYFDCIDFSRSPPYFKYDVDPDSTPDDRWHLFLDIRDNLNDLAYELTEVNIEHDRITGNVTPLTQQKERGDE